MKAKLILVAIVCLIANQTFGQTELVKELNSKIIEAKAVSPDSCLNDLNNLHNILSDKKIIGLGEATHGTHEFFVYKHRMIKHLVENENFKVFIIEGDFAGSQAMNDYVVYGKGTIKDGLMGIGYGVWFKQEFVDFIEWIKIYNDDKTLEDKIKFYGCDINNEALVAKKIKTYLNQIQELNQPLQEGLDVIIEGKLREKLSEGGTIFKEQFFSKLNNAFSSLKDEKCKEYIFMQHCKRELEQIFEFDLADGKTRIVLRDKFMAENIEWIYQFENKQKSIFWAHNEHIKNDKEKSYQKPTGYYLKDKFGDNYYSFGFGFYEGEVAGYNREEKKYDSFKVPSMSSKKLTDAVFSLCMYPNFILDLNSANKSEIISKFLHTNLYQRTIGAGFYPDGKKRNHFRMGKLKDKYDGIIFIKKTHPSVLIKKM